ncbi:MAG: hypothetical protein ACK5H2_12915 [Beutenbergiaceae bacterium]
MSRSLRRSLAVVAVAGVLVSGCATGSPGTAATVDGHAISQEEVSTVLLEVGPFVQYLDPRATSWDSTQALVAMIVAPALNEAAADGGVGVSDEDAERVLAGLAEQLDVEAPELSESSTEVVRYHIAVATIANAANSAEIVDDANARVEELDVTLSPRYGTWADDATHYPNFPWIQRPQQ